MHSTLFFHTTTTHETHAKLLYRCTSFMAWIWLHRYSLAKLYWTLIQFGVGVGWFMKKITNVHLQSWNVSHVHVWQAGARFTPTSVTLRFQPDVMSLIGLSWCLLFRGEAPIPLPFPAPQLTNSNHFPVSINEWYTYQVDWPVTTQTKWMLEIYSISKIQDMLVMWCWLGWVW